MGGKHYKNEVGTDIILDTGVLIGTATFQFINYEKPGGSVQGSWLGELYSSTSKLAGNLVGTYFVKYTLDAGDLDVSGDWKFQAWIGAIDGTWFGETVEENIYDQFE